MSLPGGEDWVNSTDDMFFYIVRYKGLGGGFESL